MPNSTQQVLDLINVSNPQLTTPVSTDNVTLSSVRTTTTTEQSNHGNRDSTLQLTAVAGKGYINSVQVFYNRIPMSALSNLGSVSFDWTSTWTQSTDLIATLNSRYGLSLANADIIAEALPTRPTTATTTTYGFKANATSLAYEGTLNLQLVTYGVMGVTANLLFTNGALVNTGAAVNASMAITGGKAPYTNPRVGSGALPTGMTLSVSGSNLVLGGTPTAKQGWTSFAARVDSADGQTATAPAVSLYINDNTWSTLDSSRTPSGVTLSTDKLTATSTNVVPIVLSALQVVTSPITGRMSWSCKIGTGTTVLSSALLATMGACQQTATGALTSQTNGFAFNPVLGTVFANGSLVGTYTGLISLANDVIQFFVDVTTPATTKVWIAKNGAFPSGVYSGTPNPATGASPLFTFNNAGGLLYPAIGLTAAPESATMNLSPTAMTSAATVLKFSGFTVGIPS